ncbi:MAG: hypothetical protein JW730_03460 [Anaerolineales bacterium]|nr:hypothetical protein [Anaerolineales bacterium]
MNTRTVPQVLVLLLVFPALACSMLGQPAQPTQAPVASEPPAQNPPTSAPQPSPVTAAGGSSEPIRQWAADAEASSEWGNPDWTASQATGGPNTFECGDLGTAWAAAGKDTVEWINLYYNTPVYPTEIRIIETYNPDQVTQVDLIDMQGQFVTVYTGQPRQVDSPCPYTLSISVNRSDILAQGVRVTIDQSALGIEWNEIDAVEIIGVPGVGTPVRPPTSTP